MELTRFHSSRSHRLRQPHPTGRSKFVEIQLSHRARVIAWGILSLLLSSLPSRGQQVNATLSPAVVAQGQRASYSVIYQGPQTEPDAIPSPPAVPGLVFEGPELEQSFTFHNNVAQLHYRLRWRVSAEEAGRYAIPAMEVRFGGRAYATQALTLEVRAGPPATPSLDPILRLRVEKAELYVGEVTAISVTALFHRRTQVRNYEHPKLPRENFVVKRFPPAGPAPYVEIDGERFQPVEFTSSLSALREGDLMVGPATIENVVVDVPLETDDEVTRGPQAFPPSFFQRVRTRQLTLTSEPVRIKVKPLPVQGRPANFAGAVGRFTLEARLAQSAQPLRVGDPIAVDLMVTGEGNFDSLSAPLPAVTEGWKLYPAKVTQENRGTGLDPGAQVWNQVIVPQQPLKEVPAYTLSYFDPTTAQYHTLRSAPIPVIIQPELARSGDPAIDPPAKDFSVLEAALPEEKLDDILTLRPAMADWQPLTPRAQDEMVLWAVQAVPAALLLAFLGVGFQRRRRERLAAASADLQGKPRSLHDIRRDLKKSGITRREFYGLAREFISAAEFHAGRPANATGLNGELHSLLERQALYCYANLPEDATTPVPRPEQNQVLTTLDKLAR